MDFLELLLTRRSIRKYTGEPIPQEALEAVLHAGLASPASRARRPWELVVVQDPATLEKLSHCRVGSAKMLAGASAAIVVFADQTKTDVWTEDCSILMSNMHLMAHALGLGSCWVQGRLRQTEAGGSTEAFCRGSAAGSCSPSRSTVFWRPSSPWASPRSTPQPTHWMIWTGTGFTTSSFNVLSPMKKRPVPMDRALLARQKF